MSLNNELQKLIKEADVPEGKKKALLRQLGMGKVRSGRCFEDHGSHANTLDMRDGFRGGRKSGVGKWGGVN